METCNAHDDVILSASALTSTSLDLSRKGIVELPENMPWYSKLECLYLEGNCLSSLPESLFHSCPNLRWLDLRNNRLRVLPSTVERLTSLKTLLLEGNQLTTLPPQLGRLHHLTGLNLSRNPLQCPPKHVAEKGTRAVLAYLCELLLEPEEGENEDSIEPNLLTPHPEDPLYPPRNSIVGQLQADYSSSENAGLASSLPLPLPRQATLHSQLSLKGSGRVQLKKHTMGGEETPSPEHPGKKGKRGRRKGDTFNEGRKRENHQELTVEEKVEITAAVERLKSQQCLEDWRAEARDRQRQHSVTVYVGGQGMPEPTAPEKAPYATNQQLGENEVAHSGLTFVAVDGQRKAVLNLHRRSSNSSSSLRDVREHQVSDRVKQYQQELQVQRRQVGLIHDPSPELLEAERKLAEAVIHHQELETRKNLEYRLTAYTGDLHTPI